MKPPCHNRPELTAYLHPSGELIQHRMSQPCKSWSTGDRATPVPVLEGYKLGWAAAWATPATRDHKDTDTVPRHAFGLVNGESAQTAKRGSLNPALSRWLMGYPPEWCACAPTETPSSRKRPPLFDGVKRAVEGEGEGEG